MSSQVFPSNSGLTLFAQPLRPFFLGAGIYGALVIPVWLWITFDGSALPSPLPPVLWHGHEMIFGYAAAALAGFLLTAAPSWRGGRPALRGWPLAGLAAVWLAGRLAAWLGAPTPVFAAVLGFAFPLLLMMALAPYLWGGARRNVVFLGILGLLAAAEALVYLDALDIAPGLGTIGLRLGVEVFALMIAIIGGRVTRAFTANALEAISGPKVRAIGLIDRLAVLSVVVFVLADLFVPGPIAGWLAVIAAVLNALRMVGWRSFAVRGLPIVWVLHLGYAWLVVGLALVGLDEALGLPFSGEALHALTVGAIGTMTLGIMTRAGLGHTGRRIVAHPLMVVAYGLVTLATLARIAPAVWPEAYEVGITVSGLCWTVAFLLFTVVYGSVFLRPRADGKPG